MGEVWRVVPGSGRVRPLRRPRQYPGRAAGQCGEHPAHGFLEPAPHAYPHRGRSRHQDHLGSTARTPPAPTSSPGWPSTTSAGSGSASGARPPTRNCSIASIRLPTRCAVTRCPAATTVGTSSIKTPTSGWAMGLRASIVQFDTTGHTVVYWDIGNTAAPRGSAADAAGAIWWATRSRKLGRLEPATNTVTTFTLPDAGQPNNAIPYMVAVHDGKIWYTAQGDEVGTLGVLDPALATGSASTARRRTFDSAETCRPPLASRHLRRQHHDRRLDRALAHADLDRRHPCRATGWSVYEAPVPRFPMASPPRPVASGSPIKPITSCCEPSSPSQPRQARRPARLRLHPPTRPPRRRPLHPAHADEHAH